MRKDKTLTDSLDAVLLVEYKPLGDKGEDTYAFALDRPDLHTVAVFDGCGGAGAWKYPEYGNATGAFLAAQFAQGLYLSWCDGIRPEDCRDPERLAADLTACLTQAFRSVKAAASPMGIGGSLVKSLPCTASIALMTAAEQDRVLLTALNIGDSRVYMLNEDYGLVQLTRDDTRGNPDALESLRVNAPLSDMINADRDFRIKHRQVMLEEPCAVLCATDGMFGYLPTPMHFEYLLLDSLMHSATPGEFESRLREGVVRVTGDDSTCMMALYGWDTHDAFRRRMTPRYQAVQRLIERIDSAPPGEKEARIAEVWAKYRCQTIFDEMQV